MMSPKLQENGERLFRESAFRIFPIIWFTAVQLVQLLMKPIIVQNSDCDAPMSLVNTTFDWLKQEWADKVDFVVCKFESWLVPFVCDVLMLTHTISI